MYGKNHYNIVISLQLIKINGKKINKKDIPIHHSETLIPVPVFREDFRNNEGEKMRYKLLHRNSATEQVKNSLLAVTGSRLESYRVQAIRFS